MKRLELDGLTKEAKKKVEVMNMQRDQNEKRIEISFRILEETESKLIDRNQKLDKNGV